MNISKISRKTKPKRELHLHNNKSKSDTERDYFMDANEALEYGLIDKIIKK